MKLHFEIYEKRWISARFEAEEKSFEIVITSILFDSLLALADLPLAFAQWGSATNRIEDMPEFYELSLRQEGTQAVFEISELADFKSLPGSGRLIFST